MTNDGYDKFGREFEKTWKKEGKDTMGPKDLGDMCTLLGGRVS